MKPLDPHRIPTEGTQLIEASAGTGKTYTITSLYVRLILERELGVDEILVVTFTRAATAELRDRLRRRLRAAVSALASGGSAGDDFLDTFVANRKDPAADCRRLTRELRRFDEAAVFTIHGFCQRVLNDHAFESGIRFDAQLVADSGPLLREITQDFWTERVCAAEPAFVEFLRARSFDLDTLGALCRLAWADPEQQVLPSPGEERWEEAWTRASALHEQAVALWQAERDAVVARVTMEGLNKSWWSPKNRATRVALLDTLLAPGTSLPATVPDTLRQFTPAKLARATGKAFAPPEHPFFPVWGDFCDALDALGEAGDQRLLNWKLEFLQWARRETRRRKAATGTQFYDDLLQQLDEALQARRGESLARAVRRRYSAALIDEFQDTDPTQYRIFGRVFRDLDATLYLIGDPKQAIYGFRSADIFAYLDAAREAGSARHTLDTNWRSDPGLIRAVNHVFSRPVAPFLFDEIPFTPVEPRPQAQDGLVGDPAWCTPFDLLYLSGATLGEEKKLVAKGVVHHRLPTVVASDIARLLRSDTALASSDGGPPQELGPGDIAILVRKNQQGAAMQAALRSAGVPSVLHSGASVLDTAEAEEMGALLQALGRPGSPSLLRAALATPLLGLDAVRLYTLTDDELGWEQWAQKFRRWAALWERTGFLQAFTRVLADEGVERRTLELPGGERRLTNLLHLGELLHLASKRHRLGPEALARWLSLARQGAGLEGISDEDARQIRIESDHRAVQVLTMHKCKGLEYPVVYCPYLWDSARLLKSDLKNVRFHDPADGWRRKVDLGSELHKEHQAVANREALAEGLRLAYVAITRARHRCSVVWGPFKGVDESALGYLLHQGSDAAAGDPALWQKVVPRIRKLGDAGVREDLEALVAQSEGSITLREASVEPAQVRLEEGRQSPESLSARVFAGPVRRTLRSSSFTALVSGADSALSPAAREGLDRDEDQLTDPAAPSGPEPATLESEPPVPLHDFPRGAQAGSFFHLLLETVPFDASEEVRRDQGARLLRRFGFDPAAWTDRVADALGQWLAMPIQAEGGTLTLADVAAADRRAELEFTLPVAQGEDGSLTRLTLGRLAAAFEAGEKSEPDLGGYGAWLRRVPHQPLSGWLRGFIDLVVRHDGRWYLLDWKTNHLGDHPQDYARPRLVEEMARDHYLLQAHLYAVALHRHLAAHLPGYRYEEHFGGVHYLFLRGLHPSHPPGSGVWFNRPSEALVERLSAVVDGRGDPSGGAP